MIPEIIQPHSTVVTKRGFVGIRKRQIGRIVIPMPGIGQAVFAVIDLL